MQNQDNLDYKKKYLKYKKKYINLKEEIEGAGPLGWTGEHHKQLIKLQKKYEKNIIFDEDDKYKLNDLINYYNDKLKDKNDKKTKKKLIQVEDLLKDNFFKTFQNHYNNNDKNILTDRQKILLGSIIGYYENRGSAKKESEARLLLINFNKRVREDLLKRGIITTKYDEEVEKINQERSRRRAESDPILKDAWNALINKLKNELKKNNISRKELLKNCDGDRPWFCLWKNINKNSLEDDLKNDLRNIYKKIMLNDNEKILEDVFCNVIKEWKNTPKGSNDTIECNYSHK
jgi:hypothetical protein